MITSRMMLVSSVSAALLFTASNIAQAQQPQKTLGQTQQITPSRNTKQAALLTDNAKKLLDSWDAVKDHLAPLNQAMSLLVQAQTADDQYAPSYLQTARYNLLMLYAYTPSSDKAFTSQAISMSEMATKHALALDPKLSDAYIVLADIYQIAGDLKKSAANLDMAEKLGCKNPWLNIQRALIVARTSSPTDKAVLDHLAIALKRAEKTGEYRAVQTAAYGIASYYQDQKQDKMAAPYLKKSEQAHNQILIQAKAISSNS